jgi:hypothetical protein
MNLTKSELELADRCLSKREKQVAQWPQRRWLMLAIFAAFTLLGYLTLSDGVHGIQDDQAVDMQVSRAIGEDPPPGLETRWMVGSMMKIAKVLELRHQVVSWSLLEVALGSMQILWAVIVVCLTLLRWNTGERDALICKLLRGKLQELQQEAARNPAPGS